MTMVIKIILDLIPNNNTVLTTISASSPEAEIAKHKKHGLALDTSRSHIVHILDIDYLPSLDRQNIYYCAISEIAKRASKHVKHSLALDVRVIMATHHIIQR